MLLTILGALGLTVVLMWRLWRMDRNEAAAEVAAIERVLADPKWRVAVDHELVIVAAGHSDSTSAFVHHWTPATGWISRRKGARR